MLHLQTFECKVTNLICNVVINLENESVNTSKNNLDIWINEEYLLFNWNNIYKKITAKNEFDIKDLKKIEINYDNNASTITFELPCLEEKKKRNRRINKDKYQTDNNNNEFDVLKLKKITDSCILKIDGVETLINNNYIYGFNGNYAEDTSLVKSDLKSICRIINPSNKSPVERFYKRESDESKDFCQDQYKLNFIELQVPEGLENPMNYTLNFHDQNLNSKEDNTLKTICSKPLSSLSEKERQRIDNELVGILLGICYDIRTNAGEINCESGWTRSILSPVLSYFEPTLNLESAIEVFLRRSLIYPLYRNYDLSRVCVEDTIQALQKGYKWILKQMLLTYYSFLESEDNRQLLNKYYIEDYIRYINSVATSEDFKFLAKNLKNSLLRISKKNLRLELLDIETEILKELISDIHLANSDDSDDDDDDDENDDENDDETNSSDNDSDNNSDNLSSSHSEDSLRDNDTIPTSDNKKVIII